jgi:hypothetical protein
MMAHAPLMLAACVGGFAAPVLGAFGLAWRTAAWPSAAILGALAMERVVAGVRAAVRHRDPAGLWFAPVHLLRDVAWAWAIVTWAARRVARTAGHPRHSMPGSHGSISPPRDSVY